MPHIYTRKVPVGTYKQGGDPTAYEWAFDLGSTEDGMTLTVVTHLENNALHLTMSRAQAAALAKAILQTLSEED